MLKPMFAWIVFLWTQVLRAFNAPAPDGAMGAAATIEIEPLDRDLGNPRGLRALRHATPSAVQSQAGNDCAHAVQLPAFTAQHQRQALRARNAQPIVRPFTLFA
jgi:hypothetical protein